jgi:hypothetical protein
MQNRLHLSVYKMILWLLWNEVMNLSLSSKLFIEKKFYALKFAIMFCEKKEK